MDSIKTIWSLLLELLYLQSMTAGYDPCTDATELNSLHRRLSGYTLGPGETPLCDSFLISGWYSVMNLFLATSPPASCGTLYIWWMNDTLPGPLEVGLILTKKVCLKTSSDDCDYTESISMVNCGNRFVYYLLPTLGCPEAYCLDMEGPKPTGDVSAPSVSLSPYIEVEPEIEKFNNSLQFYCKFDRDKDESLWYIVQWYRGDSNLGTMLSESSPTQFSSWEEFKLKTALKEEKMMKRIGIYLVCSVRAKQTEFGASSEAFISEPFFAGIEILNNSVIYLNGLQNPQVFIRSTIPFACIGLDHDICVLYVNVLIGLESHCLLPGVATSASSACGIKILRSQWNKPVPLNVVLKLPQSTKNIKSASMEIHLRTPPRFLQHPIFEKHLLPQSVKVQISPNVEVLKGKICYAVCDPHMKTFDGVKYENQHEGTFVMYKNMELEAEVQIRTKACYGNHQAPFCPCGIAVRAGRDVFIINRCDTEPEIRTQQCSDHVLDGKIKEAGNVYKVYLPTGSEVQIEKGMDYFYNIYIQASLSDYNRTTGLCGYLDESKASDLRKRDKTPYTPEISNDFDDPEDFNNEWRVRPNENLFNSNNHPSLSSWKREIYVCTCDRFGTNEILDEATCEPGQRAICERNTEKLSPAGKCTPFEKRSTNDIEDKYNTVEVDPHEIQELPIKLSKRSNSLKTKYTESDARIDCGNYLNSSLVFQKCSHIPGLDVQSFVDTCVMDAMLTNSMDWAGIHLESAKTNCISQVQLNQPIPKDVLERFENLTNPANSSEISQNITGEVTSGPPINDDDVYTDALLNELQSLSCPMDCDEHGICKNGSCECFQGYGDIDCSVDLSQPPTVIGIPDLGLCDVQQRPCKKTSVLGLNFIDARTLSCRLADFKVRHNGTEEAENKRTLTAMRISNVEVECTLPESRDTRVIDSEAGDISYLARGYRVSVSNNGELFSHESTLLIFDSACVNCTKAGFDIKCILQHGFCLMDGNCYRVSESRGCLICEMTHDNLFSWVNGPDCTVPKTSMPIEASQLWIIGAVLGPVGLISLIVAVTLSIKKCTRTKRVTASQEWTDSVTKSSVR